MQLFYGTAIEGNMIILSEQESGHCAKVLRMKAGNVIDVTNGNGYFYKGIIRVLHDKRTIIDIIETIPSKPLPYQLNLYVALTKHTDRVEWMLEKCVEIGLTSFTPIITNRTERTKIRMDRLNSIALSAMKQSVKAWLPQINPVCKFEDIIKSLNSGTKLIAHCLNDDNKISLTNIKMEILSHIFIGPEGDFTIEEVNMAKLNGFQATNMGTSRLRTETAGVMACSFMYWYNINT